MKYAGLAESRIIMVQINPSWYLSAMKKLYILITIIILFSGCSSNQKTQGNELAQSRYQLLQGVNYYKARQYNQAMEAINKSLAIVPDNPQTHLMAALINQQLGFKLRAENSFIRALSHKPVSANILNNYANFLCEQQQYAIAESYFEQAANLESNKAPDVTFTNAGLCSLKSGQHYKAEAWFNKALVNNPAQGSALYQLASLKLQKGKTLEASTLLNQFLKHRPHTAKTLLLGARIEQNLGNKTSVDSYLQQLATNFPASNENRSARAMLAKPVTSYLASQPQIATTDSVPSTYPPDMTSTMPSDTLGESWVLNQLPTHYTLQIIATQNSSIADQIYNNLTHTQGQEWNPVKYQFKRNNGTWYNLIEGSYPDSKAARQALSMLPAEAKKYRPWIRRFDSIQRVISSN